MIIILCGKSGSGKDAILSKLEDKGFDTLITATTRPIREGEVDGYSYIFKTNEEFENMIKEDKLIEHKEYHTLVNGKPDVWYYGTPKYNLKKHHKYVIILTPDGARKLKEYYKDQCFVCYIDTTDSIRRKRAKKRGSFDETEWERRVKADAEDFDFDKIKDVIDAVIENNYKIDTAVNYILRKFNKFQNRKVEDYEQE